MSRLSHELDGLALDLAWSQWTELGVDSIVRRHEWRAIDLEPLIIFTASRGSDSRLRSASIEWCIDNGPLASVFHAVAVQHVLGHAVDIGGSRPGPPDVRSVPAKP